VNNPTETTLKFSKHAAVCILAGAISGTSPTLPAAAVDEPARPSKPMRDGQHDFDFNIGVWKTHIKRVLDPLSGSTKSIELNGTVTVRKVWAYSDDGAKTWVPAFIANLTREKP
jgi:hypothetical protein